MALLESEIHSFHLQRITSLLTAPSQGPALKEPAAPTTLFASTTSALARRRSINELAVKEEKERKRKRARISEADVHLFHLSHLRASPSRSTVPLPESASPKADPCPVARVKSSKAVTTPKPKSTKVIGGPTSAAVLTDPTPSKANPEQPSDLVLPPQPDIASTEISKEDSSSASTVSISNGNGAGVTSTGKKVKKVRKDKERKEKGTKVTDREQLDPRQKNKGRPELHHSVTPERRDMDDEDYQLLSSSLPQPDLDQSTPRAHPPSSPLRASRSLLPHPAMYDNINTTTDQALDQHEVMMPTYQPEFSPRTPMLSGRPKAKPRKSKPSLVSLDLEGEEKREKEQKKERAGPFWVVNTPVGRTLT